MSGTETTQAAATGSKLKTMSLGELGCVLPIGARTPGGFAKSFTLKPFRFKEEKDLAVLKEQAGNVTGGRFASLVLGTMLEEVGGTNIQGMKKMEERVAFLAAMYMPDVLYMYVYLRYEAMGEDIRLNVTCPHCRQPEPFSFVGDLRTTEVRTVTEPGALVNEFTLAKGLPYRGATRQKVKTTCPLWSSFESRSIRNMAAIQSSVMQSAICGLDGIPEEQWTPLPDNVLEELPKRDYEALQRHIVSNTPGPIMKADVSCRDCQRRLIVPLDWGYDHFFGASSL